MKTLNTLLKINVAAAVIVAFTLGCENVSNPDPVNVIDTTKTATITGEVTAQLDVSDPEPEPAPAGTKVKIAIDSRNFVTDPQPGVRYQELIYTTTLDAAGTYSVEVPALNGPVFAIIYLDNFTSTVEGTGTDEEEVFSSNPNGYPVQIIAGLTTYEDIAY